MSGCGRPGLPPTTCKWPNQKSSGDVRNRAADAMAGNGAVEPDTLIGLKITSLQRHWRAMRQVRRPQSF